MMKITILIMIVIMIFLMPVMLCAMNLHDAGNQMISVLTPIILLAMIPVVGRFFKKIGIDIGNDQISTILTTIINILVNLDLKNPKMSSADKKLMAVKMVKEALPQASIDALRAKYGSVETAVQAAFEKSSLNKQLKVVGSVTSSPK